MSEGALPSRGTRNQGYKQRNISTPLPVKPVNRATGCNTGMSGGALPPRGANQYKTTMTTMAKSEAYNLDCIEYMRSLPDNHFDLAVCDPPYGHGNDESLLRRGGGSGRCSNATSYNRFQGGFFPRYFHPMEQAQRRTERTILQPPPYRPDGSTGGKTCKPRHGMSPLRRSSSMSFSA